MNNLIFIDSVWKFLVVVTVPSYVIYAIALFSYHSLVSCESALKIKRHLNLFIAFLLAAVSVLSLLLLTVDSEIIAGCFNQFSKQVHQVSLTRTTATLYLLVVFALAIKDIVRIYQDFLYHKNLPKLQEPRIQLLLSETQASLQNSWPVHLLYSDKPVSPYVWGLLKPSLVITPTVESISDLAKIRSILAHELMHIQGRDALWLLLGHIAKRIFFFNPLAFYFCKIQRLTFEKAADQKAVTDCKIEAKTLFSALLEIATSTTKNDKVLLTTSASRDFNELKARFESLGRIHSTTRSWKSGVVTAILLVTTISILVVQTRASIVSVKKDTKGFETMMCSQINHEKILESWLGRTHSPNKCEMK